MPSNQLDEEECLDIVDEKDRIVGKDTKENKIKNNLISRNVVIFVLDKSKNLLITKRSPHKKTYPNKYDASAVGNIKAGEKPEDATQRELKEELSVQCDLKFAGKVLNEFYDGDLFLRYYSYIFLGIHNGDVELGSELTELQKIPLHQIEEMVNKEKQNLFRHF